MRTAISAMLVLLCLGLAACEKGTRIKSVEPSFGNVAGGDDVIIHGSGFREGVVVQFGKNEVKSVVIDSSARLRVKTPSGAEGKTDVIVIRDDGKTFVLKDGFSYTRDAPAGK